MELNSGVATSSGTAFNLKSNTDRVSASLMRSASEIWTGRLQRSQCGVLSPQCRGTHPFVPQYGRRSNDQRQVTRGTGSVAARSYLRFQEEPSMRSLAFCLALLTLPLSAQQVTGTWNGTYTLTYRSCPGAFNGPAALYARQNDGTFVAVLDIQAISNETCTLTAAQLALPISGSISDGSVSAIIFGPFENQSAAFSGTIAGSTWTATFADFETSVTLALSQTNSAPPDSTITGTYAGTYTVTDTLASRPCPNLPSLAFSGPLIATVLQGGPLVSGIVELRDLKVIERDGNGLCTIVNDPEERIGLMGRISGNAIAGLIFYAFTFPATATVQGETIMGSAGGNQISLTFSLTRTSTTLLPTILEFEAEPSTIARGGATTLHWTVFNASTASIDHGVGTKAPAGAAVISPGVTTTYTLTAISATGTTATATTKVTVTGSTEKRRSVHH